MSLCFASLRSLALPTRKKREYSPFSSTNDAEQVFPTRDSVACFWGSQKEMFLFWRILAISLQFTDEFMLIFVDIYGILPMKRKNSL